MKVAVVTDTNSGISVEEGIQLGVDVIPMPIMINGQIYYEGVTLTHDDFYRCQAAGQAISTSQPAPGGGRVQVVNNHRISVTQRNAVMDALALAAAGCSAAEIREELEHTSLDSIIYIGVDTRKYLKQGGWITPAATAMATILHLKPLLKIEGERLDAFATVRGRKACKQKLLDAMQRSVEEFHQRDWPICVGVSGSFLSLDEEQAWLTPAKKTFPGEYIRYNPLALSIGCHTGPDAFGMTVSRRIVRT